MFLERPLAMFLGFTVLPLRTLYHSIQFALATLLFGMALIIGIPILFGYLLFKASFSLTLNFLINAFVVLPIVSTIVTIGLSAASAYLVYVTMIDLFTITWQGLKSGFVDGMPGFWRTLGNQHSYFEGFYVRLMAFINRVSVQDQINLEDFNALELVDVVVPRRDLVVPDIQVAAPSVESSLLQSTEIKEAEDLVKKLAALTLPLPMDMKANKEQLKTRLGQYKVLSANLESVKEALSMGNLSDIKDQVIAFNEIKIPILLLKQYKVGERWYSVPATGFVTDKETIITWLKQSAIHPLLSQETINRPSEYKNMPTRYRWHVLTAEKCYAQELGEGAEEIRGLLIKLPEQLKALLEKKPNQGTSSRTLFAKTKPATDLVQGEKELDETNGAAATI